MIGLSPPRSLPYEVVYVAYSFWEAEALLVSRKIRTAKVFLFVSFMPHSCELGIVQDLNGHTIATPAGSTSQSGAEAAVVQALHRQQAWVAAGL